MCSPHCQRPPRADRQIDSPATPLGGWRSASGLKAGTRWHQRAPIGRAAEARCATRSSKRTVEHVDTRRLLDIKAQPLAVSLGREVVIVRPTFSDRQHRQSTPPPPLLPPNCQEQGRKCSGSRSSSPSRRGGRRFDAVEGVKERWECSEGVSTVDVVRISDPDFSNLWMREQERARHQCRGEG